MEKEIENLRGEVGQLQSQNSTLLRQVNRKIVQEENDGELGALDRRVSRLDSRAGEISRRESAAAPTLSEFIQIDTSMKSIGDFVLSDLKARTMSIMEEDEEEKELLDFGTQTDALPRIDQGIQTEVVRAEFSTQTESTAKQEISLQTEKSSVMESSIRVKAEAKEFNLQTDPELKPVVKETTIQTDDQPKIPVGEFSVQTDPEKRPLMNENYMQTEAEQKKALLENSSQTDGKKTQELTTMTDPKSTNEFTMMTDSKPTKEFTTMTDAIAKPSNSDGSYQTDPPPQKKEAFLQTETAERKERDMQTEKEARKIGVEFHTQTDEIKSAPVAPPPPVYVEAPKKIVMTMDMATQTDLETKPTRIEALSQTDAQSTNGSSVSHSDIDRKELLDAHMNGFLVSDKRAMYKGVTQETQTDDPPRVKKASRATQTEFIDPEPELRSQPSLGSSPSMSFVLGGGLPRPSGGRKDPHEEFFIWLCQSAKLNHPKQSIAVDVNTSGYYAHVMREKLPFNKWNDWIIRRLDDDVWMAETTKIRETTSAYVVHQRATLSLKPNQQISKNGGFLNVPVDVDQIRDRKRTMDQLADFGM
eukprot:TRINITY_DN11701_c0_g1_i1.p1 TRINITY_DN11701_c0_g1~~TRINITY_DN11701_c0_g1_i1.p1  ORF type:complete len:587 (-),score=92.24 TRINITY_DN11701_c0_g1_i1:294-2054(-)